jgi:hypothetical protein
LGQPSGNASFSELAWHFWLCLLRIFSRRQERKLILSLLLTRTSNTDYLLEGCLLPGPILLL